MICGNGPCGRSPPLPGGKAGTAPRAALHDKEAGQTCACAQARPAALNDQVTAMRGQQPGLSR
ncbi:MAG: hypothetical protein Q7R35_13480, partial [Elusimicrobiota bacterium]|nr:hypothetical protein [Elusimicrobiota bacterium]